MTVLTRILEKKAGRLRDVKGLVGLGELKARVRDVEAPRDFRAAVARGAGAVRLIAEVKRASPSKGLIRSDFNLDAIAGIYRDKPVSAVSVLTEEDFFMGHLSYLERVRVKTSKPVLRKDFIFDEYQVYEARAWGADALLLICSALEPNKARDLLSLSAELRMAVLFEIHHERDLDVALRIGADVIGINNRDLDTLEIDLSTTPRLKARIPDGKIVVSESGIRGRDDALLLAGAGIDALLVGTSLMASGDTAAKIDELLGLPPAPVR
jgi:indole-3-glycerol phosphate synthase